MIQLQEIIRAGAMFECTQPLLIDPACIETARPDKVSGFDGAVCRLQITNEEKRVFVAGTTEDLYRRIEALEITALERLAAIKEIVDGGT